MFLNKGRFQSLVLWWTSLQKSIGFLLHETEAKEWSTLHSSIFIFKMVLLFWSWQKSGTEILINNFLWYRDQTMWGTSLPNFYMSGTGSGKVKSLAINWLLETSEAFKSADVWTWIIKFFQIPLLSNDALLGYEIHSHFGPPFKSSKVHAFIYIMTVTALCTSRQEFYFQAYQGVPGGLNCQGDLLQANWAW